MVGVEWTNDNFLVAPLVVSVESNDMAYVLVVISICHVCTRTVAGFVTLLKFLFPDKCTLRVSFVFAN